MLREGVKIFRDTGVEISLDTLRLSHGTASANSTDAKDFYCPDAIVPKGGWRTPTKEEFAYLCCEHPCAAQRNAIRIVHLPNHLLQKFLPFSQVLTEADFDTLVGPHKASTPLGDLLDFLSAYTSTTIETYGFGINSNNLLTVTMTGNCFEGLHVDQGGGSLGKNRLMLNLGSQLRYLLYVNLDLEDIRSHLAKIGSEFSFKGKTRLGREFLRAFPDYPVVRVRINPGEGYIAPADQIIHDGSTQGTNRMDVVFTALNEFEFFN